MIGLITLMAATVLVPASYSQEPAPPSFEVASIKHSDPKRPLPPGFKLSSGRFEATGMTLRNLIAMAYQMNFDTSQQISGGPAWISSEKFDIVATVDASALAQLNTLALKQQGVQYRSMIQQLLAERFNLEVHRGTLELKAYALRVEKGGPKLKPGVVEPNLPENVPQTRINLIRAGYLAGHNATIAQLANVLSVQRDIGGRTVVDKTGLSGKYDFTLKWTPDSVADVRPPGTETSEDVPPLFTAIREQLGLRLESAIAPVEVVTVDRAEMPSEN